MLTPDDLDEFERRTYDVAVLPIPLAEVAVRLGLSTPLTVERIERLCARLGVADREGLRTWGKGPTAELPEDEPIIDFTIPGAPGPRHSRRSFVIAAGLVGLTSAAAATVAAFAWRGGGPKKTAEPQATTIPDATLEPADGLTRVSFAETWEVKNFAKGELIDWPHGLFLMGVEGGEVRGHRLRATDAINYQTSAQGRFVAGERQKEGFTSVHLMDILNTETSWSWSQQQLRLIGVVGNLPEATLLFERKTDSNKGTGELRILKSPGPHQDLEISFSAAIYPTGFTAPLITRASEKAVAIASVDEQLT
ncbi:MAG: hypothetical protein ABI577_08080, partial [bacterium]